MPKHYHSTSILQLISVCETTQLKKMMFGFILICLSFSINFIAALPKEKFTLGDISFWRACTLFTYNFLKI